ncbi:2-oxoglutarate (2OG) and Fe(II)-dependent oxygenase superfamily protein [Artemisia annua]|uniref:2-oxoglutarate (2OG) and Fe(II)-dependent oxygenase superfamily protein n=1 Tax=Artemisia annua TaxID=35608 RepID=A0A2U1PFQ3_ARTAN|nr:2-oxoglutarate (2OG) and Fe(II)-dependent oxygenase superfamily protein [Artemisia annua]
MTRPWLFVEDQFEKPNDIKAQNLINACAVVVCKECRDIILAYGFGQVQAPKGEKATRLERSLFVLFMKPNWDELLNFPETEHVNQEWVQANESLTFGEYTEKLLDKYYHLKK